MMIHNLARNAATASWLAPTATVFAGNVEGPDGWSPRPTQDPLNYELFKRQVGNRTCGYRNGKRRTPMTCIESSLCVTNTFFGFIGCCDPDGIESCTPPTACVPSSDLDNCDSRCQAETKTVKCPNASAPNCMTAYHDYITTQFTEYRCGGNTRFTAFPTFSGQSTATLARTSQSSPVIIVPGDEDEAISEDFEGAEAASPDNADSAEDAEDAEDERESDDSAQATLVGGVVGGLSVFAFLVLGLIALLLRHRRLKARQMFGDPAAGQRGMKFDGSDASLHNQIATHWHGRRVHMRSSDRSRNGSESSNKFPMMKDSREISEAP